MLFKISDNKYIVRVSQLIRSLIVSLVVVAALPFLLGIVAGITVEYTNIMALVVIFAVNFIATLTVAYTAKYSAGSHSDSYDDEYISENDDREYGTVKWFNVSKGFGFITRGENDDVFVHFRNIRGRGHRSLMEGQQVRFYVRESDKGLQAEDVSVVSG